MFNRRTFDLIVLSLLHDHQEGLTAYQLLKLLKEHFTPLWNPSAGALYPLLRKMVQTGEIVEETGDSDQSHFIITEVGLKRLQNIIPEVLNTSLESLPLIFDALSKALPYASRIQYASDMPRMFRIMSQNFPFNNQTHHEQFGCCSNSIQIDRLEKYKADLSNAKAEIESWVSEEINQIDSELRWIIEQLEHCREDKKNNWVKIPIEDEESPDRSDSGKESESHADS